LGGWGLGLYYSILMGVGWLVGGIGWVEGGSGGVSYDWGFSAQLFSLFLKEGLERT